MQAVSDEISSNALDLIKKPFASKHVMKSSFIAVEEQTIKRDFKVDDEILFDQKCIDEDEEPAPTKICTYGASIRIDKKPAPPTMHMEKMYDDITGKLGPRKHSSKHLHLGNRKTMTVKRQSSFLANITI